MLNVSTCVLTQDEKRMYKHFREREIVHKVNPKYLRHQPDLSEHLRMMVVNQLSMVHLYERLNPETLFLAVNLLDRYLGCVEIYHEDLQVIGATCLLLASKYEESPPSLRIDDFLHLFNHAFAGSEVSHFPIIVLVFFFLKDDSLTINNVYTPILYTSAHRHARDHSESLGIPPYHPYL